MAQECNHTGGDCYLDPNTVTRIHERMDKISSKENWMLGVGACAMVLGSFILDGMSKKVDEISVLREKVVRLETKMDVQRESINDQKKTLDQILTFMRDKVVLAPPGDK